MLLLSVRAVGNEETLWPNADEKTPLTPSNGVSEKDKVPDGGVIIRRGLWWQMFHPKDWLNALIESTRISVFLDCGLVGVRYGYSRILFCRCRSKRSLTRHELVARIVTCLYNNWLNYEPNRQDEELPFSVRMAVMMPESISGSLSHQWMTTTVFQDDARNFYEVPIPWGFLPWLKVGISYRHGIPVPVSGRIWPSFVEPFIVGISE